MAYYNNSRALVPISLDLISHPWDYDANIYHLFKKETMIPDSDFLDPKEMTMYIAQPYQDTCINHYSLRFIVLGTSTHNE